jgi:hypothetical protein
LRDAEEAADVPRELGVSAACGWLYRRAVSGLEAAPIAALGLPSMPIYP